MHACAGYRAGRQSAERARTFSAACVEYHCSCMAMSAHLDTAYGR